MLRSNPVQLRLRHWPSDAQTTRLDLPPNSFISPITSVYVCIYNLPATVAKWLAKLPTQFFFISPVVRASLRVWNMHEKWTLIWEWDLLWVNYRGCWKWTLGCSQCISFLDATCLWTSNLQCLWEKDSTADLNQSWWQTYSLHVLLMDKSNMTNPKSGPTSTPCSILIKILVLCGILQQIRWRIYTAGGFFAPNCRTIMTVRNLVEHQQTLFLPPGKS